MNPNLYLKTFWISDMRPEIFVAMQFSKKFKRRYKNVIAPAIKRVKYDGTKLKPRRIDLSKTGDCIHTEIIDGIAHSALIIADISICGYDKDTKDPYRNGNVMYELGLALACRQPTEVLIIKDDKYRTLFDINTVPYTEIDFSKKKKARKAVSSEIDARIKELKYLKDARVQIGLATLSAEEASLLCEAATRDNFSPDAKLTIDDTASRGARFSLPNPQLMVAIPRLIDKQLIRVVEVNYSEAKTVYEYT